MGREAFKAGLFTLIALGILSLFIVLISGFNPWREQTEYRTRFRMAVGLSAGTPVRMNGVPVGQVLGLKLVEEGTRVEVSFGLNGDQRLREGVRAQMATVGLLGDQFLLLIQEKAGGRELEPGSLIPSLEKLDMAQTLNALGRLASRAELILTDVQRVINPRNMTALSDSLDSWRASVSKMLKDMNAAAEGLDELIADADRVMVNANRLIADADSAVTDARVDVKSLLSEVKERLRNAEELLLKLGRRLVAAVDEDQAKVADILDGGKRVMKRVETISVKAERAADISLEELVAMSHNLTEASRHLAALVERLRENPSLLIRQVQSRP